MNKKKLPNFIILIVLTLITALFWVSFSIYQVFKTEPTISVPEEVILKINPKLDMETVNLMKEKIYPL